MEGEIMTQTMMVALINWQTTAQKENISIICEIKGKCSKAKIPGMMVCKKRDALAARQMETTDKPNP